MLENLLVLRIQGARLTNIVFAGRARESTITVPAGAVHFLFEAPERRFARARSGAPRRAMLDRQTGPTNGTRRYLVPKRGRLAALRGERAQGTVEYVALVALVALIMVGVIAAMKSTQFAEGQQLGSLILRKITEAVTKVHY
jgi:hypothetical protein